MYRHILYLLIVILPAFSNLASQEIFFERVGSFTFDKPVDIVHTGITGDNRLFMVEKGGLIKVIDDVTAESPQILGSDFLSVTVNATGEGGLLGLVFDPDYENNGYFYVYYTRYVSNEFTSFVSRFSVTNWTDNVALSNSEEVILTIPQPQTNHNGGDLVFSPEGYLLIGLGDGGGAGDPQDNGQNTGTLLGSILRIDVSSLPYKIPPDNPFIGDTIIGNDEIWSYGWRNPWKMFLDNDSGNLFVGDVGQGEYEEINIESTTVGGRNFGWNCFEGVEMYDTAGCNETYIDPVYYYDHSMGSAKSNGSVTGGVVYRGNKYPSLFGKYIFTDYIDSEIFWILTFDGASVTKVDTLIFDGGTALNRVATLGLDNNGEMYAAEYNSGALYLINAVVLPLEIIELEGQAFRDYNEITWITAYETNFDYFILERKSEREQFETITRIDGKGNETNLSVYSYVDHTDLPVAYYRLKMVDFDGSFTYSDVLKITKEAINNSFGVYPNPGSQEIFIKNPSKESLTLMVWDETGRELFNTINSSSLEIGINVADLPDGIYLLQIYREGKEELIKRFVVAH